VDLFWRENGKNWAIEIKYCDAPRFRPSMASAIEYRKLAHLWILYPGDRLYSLAAKASTLPLRNVQTPWQYI
jgi:hypothetical protein